MTYAEPLQERGLEPVDTDLPGDWAYNDDISMQIVSQRDVVTRRWTCIARVYDCPLTSFDPLKVELLSESKSDDNVKAMRLALAGAKADGDDDA